METSFALKMVAILKWLFPAALGSAIAVFIGERSSPYKSMFMFVCGCSISSIFGGGIIEHWNIPIGMIQASIYLSCGLWGMGLIIQIYHQLPIAVSKIIDKYTRQ